MRLQLIACKVLQREAYYCAARSPNQVDMVFFQQGLHERPQQLRARIQNALNNIVDSLGRNYDATILGYGLCSRGIEGLTSKIPVVVPRGHDCMTLLLGSKEKYKEYFESHRGVYWYSSGWIENSLMPGKERLEKLLAEYEQKYGKDNARYLMETEQSWIKEYSWATYIDWDFPNSDENKKFTRECAEYLKWDYDEVKGDPGLFQRLLDGKWDENDFLVIQPGQRICEDFSGDGIIKAG